MLLTLIKQNISEKQDLLSGFLRVNCSGTTNDKIVQEINKYENAEVDMTDDFDLLHWWELHKADLCISGLQNLMFTGDKCSIRKTFFQIQTRPFRQKKCACKEFYKIKSPIICSRKY